MLYTTGLLAGRAYALAHDLERSEAGAVSELHALAGGDREALLLAQARLREFAAGPASIREVHALRLLSRALQQMGVMGG
jgi:hypothetical protein